MPCLPSDSLTRHHQSRSCGCPSRPVRPAPCCRDLRREQIGRCGDNGLSGQRADLRFQPSAFSVQLIYLLHRGEERETGEYCAKPRASERAVRRDSAELRMAKEQGREAIRIEGRHAKAGELQLVYWWSLCQTRSPKSRVGFCSEAEEHSCGGPRMAAACTSRTQQPHTSRAHQRHTACCGPRMTFQHVRFPLETAFQRYQRIPQLADPNARVVVHLFLALLYHHKLQYTTRHPRSIVGCA
eukprot:3134819-Rhodomonas_salina.2